MGKIDYFDEPPRADPESPGRRGQKKRVTAHRIFKAAVELMRKDGFDRVSVDQICERADVARATFFQHFSSKAALMDVFTDIVRQRIDDELEEKRLSPTEKLHFIADHLERLTRELGPIAPEMLSAFAAEPGGGFRVDDPESGVAQLIVAIVKEGQAEGSFAADWSPEEVAIGLVSAWVGVSKRRVRRPESCSDRLLHRMLDLLLSGLTPRGTNS